MRKLKQLFRTSTLYVSSVVLIASTPMVALADDSDACAGTGHWSDRWATDPTTDQCVKLYDKDGTFVGPSYMAPQPSPSPVVSPSPEPSTAPSTGTETAGSTINDNGDNNSTNVSTNTDGTASSNTTNGATVDNDIQSSGQSGNATVKGNGSNGSAGSGDVDTNATVINSIHSTVDGGTGVATFTYDIDGDVVGDITLNGTGSNASINGTTNLNTDLNATTNSAITNDVKLSSVSGDATVDGNETGGSATTGNANAVANILNLINTIIAANQSFVGTINIKGNLNGDILLSPEFIPQLIAANNGSVMSADSLVLSTNINDDTQIVNNINLSAASGSATVDGNETGGSATSGSAQTNLTILNLTGHTVNAANSLLVFVNVLGTWVGMIVDAPGATAAAFGSGIISDTTNLASTANMTNNSRITNNVNVAAQSGNALVDGNETGGSATSGNATASANVANISTSTFNLSGWFGILYINVFGKWLGSFGVDTEAGKVVPVSGMAVADNAATITAPSLRFGFNPKQAQSGTVSTAALPGVVAASNSDDTDYQTAVLASAVASGKNGGSQAMTQTMTPVLSPREDPFSTIMMVGGFGVVGISGAMWAIRRIMEARAARSVI